MKIRKIIVTRQITKDETEKINNIQINNNEKGLFICGKNQTGKTTLLYMLEAVFGYSTSYIRRALNFEGMKDVYMMIEVEDLNGNIVELSRPFHDKIKKFPQDARGSFAGYMKIKNGSFETKDKFINYYYNNEFGHVPKVLNISSLQEIDPDNQGDYLKDLEITDYARLFIHSQNPEILSGIDYYSNTIKVLFGLISLTTREYEDEIEKLIIDYLENTKSKSIANLLTKLDKADFGKRDVNDRRAIKLFMAGKGDDAFAVKRREISNELFNKQKQLNVLFKKRFDLKSKLNLIIEKVQQLSDESLMEEYTRKLMFIDLHEGMIENRFELEEAINNIESVITEVKKEVESLKKQNWEHFNSTIDKIDEYEMNQEKIKDLILTAYKSKELTNLNKNDFDLTGQIKKIEDDFFNKYVISNLENTIDEIKEDLLQERSINENTDFELNLKMFEDLKKTNFRIFNSSFKDEFRPQGAMIDIYHLIKILIFAKTIEKSGKKIPFVIIDTPFRNENVDFYKIAPKIIINKISKLSSVENIFVASASEDGDDFEIDNLSKIYASKNDDGFSLFKDK